MAKIFKVNIEETYVDSIEVIAEDENEAFEMIEKAYKQGKIQLVNNRLSNACMQIGDSNWVDIHM